MNVRRAFLAAALQVTITAVVTTVVVLLIAMVRDVPLGSAFAAASAHALYPRPRLVVGILSTFFAGYWGASGLPLRRLEQGLLIGILVAAVAILVAVMDDELRARADEVLLQVVAAVAGAAATGLRPRIRRASVAAAIQVVTVLTLVPLAFVAIAAVMTPAGGVLPEAELAALLENVRLAGWLFGLLTAFAAGWWAARGLVTGAAQQGLLTGGMIALFVIIVIGVMGRDIRTIDIPDVALDLVAAAAGGAFAGARNRAKTT